MYNHAPQDYVCPICLGVKGIEGKDTLLLNQDLVFQDQEISVFVNSFGVGKQPGHVIVVPNKHFENLYDLPEEVGMKIFETTKKTALVLKEVLGCEGIMLVQNNEPVSGQHAFHFHLHIFPRYEEDGLWMGMGSKVLVDVGIRKELADKLRAAW